MTQSEWLDYWLSQAPTLSDESLGDIQHLLVTSDEDEA